MSSFFYFFKKQNEREKMRTKEQNNMQEIEKIAFELIAKQNKKRNIFEYLKLDTLKIERVAFRYNKQEDDYEPCITYTNF